MQTSSKLLINEYPLIVIPSLAVKIGLNEAIVLQQINYWLQNTEQSKKMNPKGYEFHCHEGRVWIYNTLKSWMEQFPFWSEKTIRRTIANLEELGVVLSGEFNAMPTDRTKWYTIDFEKLDSLPSAKAPRKSKHDAKETSDEPTKIPGGQLDHLSKIKPGQVDHLDMVKMTTPAGQVDRLLPENNITKTSYPENTLKTTTISANLSTATINEAVSEINTSMSEVSASAGVGQATEEELVVVIDELIGLGITEKSAINLVNNYGFDKVKYYIPGLRSASKTSKGVKSPIKWITSAILGDWDIEPEELPTQPKAIYEPVPAEEDNNYKLDTTKLSNDEIKIFLRGYKRANLSVEEIMDKIIVNDAKRQFIYEFLSAE